MQSKGAVHMRYQRSARNLGLGSLLAGGVWGAIGEVLTQVANLKTLLCGPGDCTGWRGWLMSPGWLAPIMVIAGAGLWYQFRPRSRIFSSRDALGGGGHTIDAELSQTRIWAVFPAGPRLTSVDAESLRNLRRLIICDPESPELPAYAERINKSVEEVQNTIRDVTRTVRALGGEVSWNANPWVSCVIGNPCSADAAASWVRYELLLPFVNHGQRPSFFVSGIDEPDMVQTAKQMFNALWAHSNPQ